jgi:hypothetical protein
MIILCCAALATYLARTAGSGGLYRQAPETRAVASHRSACDAPNTPSAAVWAVVTLSFTSSQRAPLDPFALGAGLEAQVATEDGRTRTTFRGYWDGGQLWRLRFAAPSAGCWVWRTHCLPLSAGDAGLCPRVGAVRVLPPSSSEQRKLFRHGGFLRTSPRGAAGRPHLTYSDGTPFWWLADTEWTVPSAVFPLLEFRRAAEVRRRQGFTAIQVITSP